MLKTILTSILLVYSITIWAQVTNTFPDNGHAGIGTINPSTELEARSALGNGAEIHLNAGTDNDHSVIRFQDAGTNTWGLLANYPVAGKFSLYNYQNTSVSLTVNEIGNLGIGTSNPTSKFDVIGIIKSRHANGHNIAMFSSGDGNSYLNFTGGSSSSRIGFQFDGSSKMSIYKNGGVSIGPGIPGSYKLALKGKIRAEEIKVETGWADYVFKEDYGLPTLDEVENYIKEKGHLNNIPSAKEVEENGIQLGEMNRLLLEKIEELTLYIIELKKGQETLENQYKELEQRFKNQNEL
ncbi:hypothetical protein GTQ34_16040 [Muricauda sp. JGD-17]|uniref:Uncharacterized protein n=1 Tax=Flagellimonas ochracea TaxID=2696472 RepID=A0A964TEM7_9FLAO|nr:tail fiber protein [Allomuricauda ochracea]NAY93422.1 hypothetical protein [Allomuricauda ochracea]